MGSGQVSRQTIISPCLSEVSANRSASLPAARDCSTPGSPLPCLKCGLKCRFGCAEHSDVCARLLDITQQHCVSDFSFPTWKKTALKQTRYIWKFSKRSWSLFSIGGKKGAVNVVIRSRPFFHSLKPWGCYKACRSDLCEKDHLGTREFGQTDSGK